MAQSKYVEIVNLAILNGGSFHGEVLYDGPMVTYMVTYGNLWLT